jgi:hypothetical protein
MLSRIARGVPRFSITSEQLSLSTRFSSLPKVDLARRAGITILFFVAVLTPGINSPVHLFELYSYKVSFVNGQRRRVGRFLILKNAFGWPSLRGFARVGTLKPESRN